LMEKWQKVLAKTLTKLSKILISLNRKVFYKNIH
jgi:hypothetical protein